MGLGRDGSGEPRLGRALSPLPAGRRTGEPRRPALQCVRRRALRGLPGYADRIRRDVAMQNTEAPQAGVSPQLPERTGRYAIRTGVLIRDSLQHAAAFAALHSSAHSETEL